MTTPRDQRRIPPAESTEYPWWVIIDPDVIHGLFGKDQRAGRVASAVTGPFLSREAATAQLERRRHAYSANAVVWCMTGHDSADWRAFCVEPRTKAADAPDDARTVILPPVRHEVLPPGSPLLPPEVAE